jgi:RHS repeat-associated protein
MYDPTQGRWLSEDPIAFGAGDPNLYRYTGNSPRMKPIRRANRSAQKPPQR